MSLKNWKLFTNDSVIHDWYVQAEAIGANIDVMPDVPKTLSWQLSHDNVEYYRRSIALIIPVGEIQVFASKLLPQFCVIKFYTDDRYRNFILDGRWSDQLSKNKDNCPSTLVRKVW